MHIYYYNCFDYLPKDILVNKVNPIGRAIPLDLVDVDTRVEGVYVVENYVMRLDSEAAYNWQELKLRIQAMGFDIDISSGYRSYDYQKLLIEHYTKIYGEEFIRKTWAPPGTSEHQTGLAIDFVPYREKKSKDMTDEEKEFYKLRGEKTYELVHQICHQYGFILRYPLAPSKDPNEAHPITGYKAEPWHLRYIGRQLAEEMNHLGFSTYEEFLTYRENKDQSRLNLALT